MTRFVGAVGVGLCLVFAGCAPVPSMQTGLPKYVPTTPAPALSPTPQWVIDANKAAPVKLVRNFTNSDMEHFYPKQALNNAIEGNVLLMCDWTGAGEISDCRVLEEAPTGMGFGAAAVDMVKARVLLSSRDGSSLRAGTNWPVIIRWKMG